MTQQKTQRIEEFRGIDNKSSYNNLVEQDRDVLKVFLKEAVNVDVLNSLKLARRAGSDLLAGGAFHSLWSHPNEQFGFVSLDGVLMHIDRDFVMTTIGAAPLLCAYTDANHEVYISDDRAMYVFDPAQMTLRLLDRVGTHERAMDNVDFAEEMMYYDTPPPGYALAFGFGRLLVGNAYGLFFSQYGYPQRFKMDSDYIPFNGLTVIGVVDDGIYLGTEESVYFMAGTDIKKQNFKLVSHYGAIRGTLLQTDSHKFGVDASPGRAVIWETKEGKVLGLNSGRVFTLTHDHVSYPVAETGASLIREINGQIHHLSTFAFGRQAHNPRATDIAVAESFPTVTRPDIDGFFASDFVEAEVRRNGVII